MKEKNVILVLFVLIHASHGKRYDLPAGWRGTNSKLNLTAVDLPSTSENTPSSSFRILKDANNTDITSDNATFALAFYDLANTGAFYLSVMMRAPDPSAALPVWIANRNHPVGEDSYLLMAHENGKLLLIDQANLGLPAWAPSASHVVTLGLQESGNLCLYAQDGLVVWESFADSSPTDTLLPNQLLKPGMQLSGRANESSVLFGEYSGGIDSSGLTLSVNRLGLSPQPYQVWRLNQQVMCSHPALSILGFNVQLQCSSSKLAIPFDDRALLPFLRLDMDGDLVVYAFYPDRSSWSPVFRFSSLRTDTCKLPNACGPYGICETGDRCRCIQVPKSGNETYSAVPQIGRCSGSLPRGAPRGLPQPDACSNENLNHHLVNVTGVSYFAIPYMEAIRRTTIESCAASCRWNCSCAALFFNRRTGECFFVVDEILGSLTIDPEISDNMIAMLKFVNGHLLTGPQPINESAANPPLKDPRAGRVKKIVSIAAAVVGGCLIVFLSACVILSRRSRLHKKDSAELDMDGFLSGVQGLPQRISYSALEAATRGFTTKLGSGGFGSVYEGVLNGRTVAVKKLEGNGSQGARQFVAEVATIGSISHVNVVKLSGFCVEGSHRMLVYEFMPNGSLDRWLFPAREIGDGSRTPDRRGLSWERRMDVALGTARGLAYLHEECREPIIHLDVKPQNILLDERFVAKVADFGMSKLLDNRDVSHVVTGVRGTPGYLAPEWLLHSIATKKCDVYSYGMVLLEMVGGRRNIEPSRMSSDLSWYFPAWVVNEAREGRFLELVDKTIRESAPEKQVKKMIHIALWCVQESPGSRPTMQEVVLMIEGLKEVLDPPMTFHFAVQTMVDITTSSDCASTAYISRPSLDISSLIR